MGFLKSSIKSVGTLLLADFLFYGVAQSATPIFYERIDYMKKIRSYTSIWSVEKVLYSINDFRLPFPITFTQMTWFVVSLFAVMILGNLPPLSMIEGAFLKYFGIPVAFTWFMSTKTFDGKKPYGFLKSVIAYALRPKLTYAGKKVTLGRNQPQESIKQGVKYFSELLASSERLSVDLESVIQSYNYGGGFLGYVANRGNKYTFELAQSFSKEYSGGEKVSYPNPIAIPINGGWRYNYGNMFYVQLVTQYLVTTEFDDDTVQAIMDEALKYEGWRYVYGGASPTTSFDCSGLTQWTYGKAGINLPRTAQQQYDVTQHIPLSEAQAGDLVFFHSTYNAGSYITHVGIYLGNNRMFHAGDPIGYADLTSPYWQQHLVGAGRIKQ